MRLTTDDPIGAAEAFKDAIEPTECIPESPTYCEMLESALVQKFGVRISGHDFVDDGRGRLTCIVCGYQSWNGGES